MNKERFSTYLNDARQMNEASLSDLQRTVNDYPYFTAGRIMLLKNLYVTNDSNYEKELPLAAIYAGNRALLYNYVFSSEILTENERSSEIETATTQSPTQEEKIPAFQEKNKAQETVLSEVTPQTENLEKLADKPLKEIEAIEEESSVHSFAQWLEIMSHKKLTRDEKPQKTPEKKKSWDLIDSFIQESPKISKHQVETPAETSSHNLADDSAQHHEEFMTETLAKIYIKQKHYAKAIQIFKKLSLKYPEKSIYFAGQIKIVEQLLNNKK